MDRQIRLSALSDELARVRTKKKEFLERIERIVSWGEWIPRFSRAVIKKDAAINLVAWTGAETVSAVKFIKPDR